MYSRVGESRDRFAERCDSVAQDLADQATAKIRDRLEGKMDTVRDQIESARSKVEDASLDLQTRRQDELVSGAGTLIGILMGRRSTRSMSSAGSTTRKAQQDGTEFRGESSGLPGVAQRLGLVATATLEAVHAMTKGKTGYRLVDFATTRAGGADIALAVVVDPDGVDHPLVGTAVIERDNRHVAAARATLDAINRRLDTI